MRCFSVFLPVMYVRFLFAVLSPSLLAAHIILQPSLSPSLISSQCFPLMAFLQFSALNSVLPSSSYHWQFVFASFACFCSLVSLPSLRTLNSLGHLSPVLELLHHSSTALLPRLARLSPSVRLSASPFLCLHFHFLFCPCCLISFILLISVCSLTLFFISLLSEQHAPLRSLISPLLCLVFCLSFLFLSSLLQRILPFTFRTLPSRSVSLIYCMLSSFSLIVYSLILCLLQSTHSSYSPGRSSRPRFHTHSRRVFAENHATGHIIRRLSHWFTARRALIGRRKAANQQSGIARVNI